MKAVGIISVAALLLASATVSYGQSNSGTAPENKGNTGWTGGSQDQPSQSKPGETTGQGKKVEVHDDALAKNQPLTATGEDLNGKPTRFAPSKTPE
jgi:hypothetical protein